MYMITSLGRNDMYYVIKYSLAHYRMSPTHTTECPNTPRGRHVIVIVLWTLCLTAGHVVDSQFHIRPIAARVSGMPSDALNRKPQPPVSACSPSKSGPSKVIFQGGLRGIRRVTVNVWFACDVFDLRVFGWIWRT